MILFPGSAIEQAAEREHVAQLRWPGQTVPCNEGSSVEWQVREPQPTQIRDYPPLFVEPLKRRAHGELQLEGLITQLEAWHSFLDRFASADSINQKPWLDFGLVCGDNERWRWWRLFEAVMMDRCGGPEFLPSGKVRWPKIVLTFVGLDAENDIQMEC